MLIIFDLYYILNVFHLTHFNYNHTVIANIFSGIATMIGSYYKKKRDIELNLGLIHLDLTAIEPKRDSPTDNSPVAVKAKFKK